MMSEPLQPFLTGIANSLADNRALRESEIADLLEREDADEVIADWLLEQGETGTREVMLDRAKRARGVRASSWAVAHEMYTDPALFARLAYGEPPWQD